MEKQTCKKALINERWMCNDQRIGRVMIKCPDQWKMDAKKSDVQKMP